MRGLNTIPPEFLGRYRSVGIATRYGMDVLGIESRWGEDEIFRNRPERPWASPWVKRPGRGVDYSFEPSAEVKERVQL